MPQIYDMGPTTCWGFFRPKNPTASAGFEPSNLGTKGQHATPRPPKPVFPLIPNMDTGWKWAVSFSFLPLYIQKNTSKIKYEAECSTDIVWDFRRKGNLLLIAWHHIFYENKYENIEMNYYILDLHVCNLHVCNVHQWRLKYFIIQQMCKYITYLLTYLLHGAESFLRS